ncbi:Transmembrane protein 17B [Trichinella zimbabwensis]|uniref:Transmembrane protein 17B n=1 Tax=Trichinella zimbabwensis TaxID=268475 RepID=A0A0V1HG74_9BILA|nr:Transmembrane protein 17B [Trichinella zimbabwensis]
MSAPLKREIISSLPLQMTVYFNAYFAPCWVTSHLYTLFQKVPKLAGFWITTLMLQFPMMIYQSISSDWSALPLERAVDGLQTIFLIFELIIGFFAVKRIAKFQYSKFRQQMAIKNFEKNNKIE